MDPRKLFGNQGERMAGEFLEGLGYRLLERQFRTRAGEIDLIAEDGEEIVFVEVKTRRSLGAGYPEESVHPEKLRHLALVAESYLQQKKWEAKPYRFDVVAILFDEAGTPQFTHLIGV